MNLDFTIQSDDEDNYVEENDDTQIEYIEYERIKDMKYKIPKGKQKEFVVVKCYHNGEKWTCPNPLNKQISEYIENWYNSTHAVRLRQIYMPIDVLNDILYKYQQTENTSDIVLSEL